MNDPYLDWLPNEIHLEIFKFILSPHDKWKSNWKNISVVSKQWNKNSWITFFITIPTEKRTEIFIKACRKGHLYYAQQTLLLDKKVNPSAWDNFAIIEASRHGHIEVVNLLLQDNRIESICNIRIGRASILRHTEVVKQLLEQDKRVVPSANDDDAIRWTSLSERTELVKLLQGDGRCVFS